MAKPRIGMVGYYGYGNYGDELFLKVFGQHLSDFDPVFLQDQLGRPFYTTPLEEKVAKLDAILIGGGDLVIPTYWTDQYFEDCFLTKPIYMHGIGVPTWGGEKEDIVKRMAKFFQHPNVRHIHVRDAESKVWIEQHLAPRVGIDLTPDIVCAMDLPAVRRPASPPIFGFVSRKQNPGEIHWENCRKLLDAAKAQGYKLRHILLGTGPIGEEDREGAKEFDYEGMELVTTESIDDLTRAIGECTVLASMKFHGVVVATMYGVPTIGMITTDKFRNFYKLIGREELVGHHTHKDLETRLKQPMEPISVATRQKLRAETTAGLQRLVGCLRRDLGLVS